MCVWTEGAFRLDITSGDRDGYQLGLAEVDCDDGDCWTGEDCGLDGDGGICHPLDQTGGILQVVSSVFDLVEGSTTLHHSDQQLAYYLYEIGTDTCWWWGEAYAPFAHCTDASDVVPCPVC